MHLARERKTKILHWSRWDSWWTPYRESYECTQVEGSKWSRLDGFKNCLNFEEDRGSAETYYCSLWPHIGDGVYGGGGSRTMLFWKRLTIGDQALHKDNNLNPMACRHRSKADGASVEPDLGERKENLKQLTKRQMHVVPYSRHLKHAMCRLPLHRAELCWTLMDILFPVKEESPKFIRTGEEKGRIQRRIY